MVTSADLGDRTAAQVLPAQVADAHHRLALIWADGGYAGSLIECGLARSRWSLRSSNAATTRRGSSSTDPPTPGEVVLGVDTHGEVHVAAVV